MMVKSLSKINQSYCFNTSKKASLVFDPHILIQFHASPTEKNASNHSHLPHLPVHNLGQIGRLVDHLINCTLH